MQKRDDGEWAYSDLGVLSRKRRGEVVVGKVCVCSSLIPSPAWVRVRKMDTLPMEKRVHRWWLSLHIGIFVLPEVCEGVDVRVYKAQNASTP
jgi:hypothetical protein